MAPAKLPHEVEAGLVRRLADILNDTGLSEIEVEREGLKVRVARVVQAAPAAAYLPPPPAPYSSPASAAPTISPPAEREGEVVKSPMVGTVYLQAQPGSPPFVRAGDTVSAGQTVLLIEAMKTMNPIAAPRAGQVLDVLVADAQPVEYGEPLLLLA